ncbi:hypothetical protein LguiB_028401 [Lonicera macranthoides]
MQEDPTALFLIPRSRFKDKGASTQEVPTALFLIPMHSTNAPDGYKEICLSSTGASWKKFKNTIKCKYYNAYETDEDRLAHLPPLVSPAQWENLVAYWGTEEAQRNAAQNAENRSHLRVHPRMGRKPFVIFKEDVD